MPPFAQFPLSPSLGERGLLRWGAEDLHRPTEIPEAPLKRDEALPRVAHHGLEWDFVNKWVATSVPRVTLAAAKARARCSGLP
jgi:hypothetical protein